MCLLACRQSKDGGGKIDGRRERGERERERERESEWRKERGRMDYHYLLTFIDLYPLIPPCPSPSSLHSTEVEGFFYSVVSLFHIVSPGETRGVVDSLATKIVSSGTKDNSSLRLKL